MEEHQRPLTGIQVNGRAPDPGEAELAELARLRECFRMHLIFYEVRIGRGVRFLAYRTAPGVQPHTIITDDVAELRDGLELATRTSRLAF